MTPQTTYKGRFAPSPTGPLHRGSLVAALASWLDARAHGGQWLVRMEDVDTPRTVPGAAERILQQLHDCALESDEPVVMQSRRTALYQQALDRLVARGLAYPCFCSRRDIATALQQQGHDHLRHAGLVYPGTCRQGLAQARNTPGAPLPSASDPGPCAWRMRTDIFTPNRPPMPMERPQAATEIIAMPMIDWCDRRLGAQHQNVCAEVGDFVLKRADGCFTYQLAVVVDDAAQGISHVVRGLDLADNTARQVVLQRALALPTPQYLHTPLVFAANGEKLSKQNGAQALDTSNPQEALAALREAATVLGLPCGQQDRIAPALAAWVDAWANPDAFWRRALLQ